MRLSKDIIAILLVVFICLRLFKVDFVENYSPPGEGDYGIPDVNCEYEILNEPNTISEHKCPQGREIKNETECQKAASQLSRGYFSDPGNIDFFASGGGANLHPYPTNCWIDEKYSLPVMFNHNPHKTAGKNAQWIRDDYKRFRKICKKHV